MKNTVEERQNINIIQIVDQEIIYLNLNRQIQ